MQWVWPKGIGLEAKGKKSSTLPPSPPEGVRKQDGAPRGYRAVLFFIVDLRTRGFAQRSTGHDLPLALNAVPFLGDIENLCVVEPVHATGQRVEVVIPSSAADSPEESSGVVPASVLDGYGYVHGSCARLGGCRWESQAHPQSAARASRLSGRWFAGRFPSICARNKPPHGVHVSARNTPPTSI